MGKKKLTKNLANCSPREFFIQTNKIRKAVEKWLKVTDVMAIRKKHVLQYPDLPEGASADEIDEILEDHKKKVREESMRSLNEILDVIMDEHPDETLDLIALVNFIEPKHLDEYTVAELLRNLTEIMNDEDVIGFFISLMRLEKLNILSA